MFIEVPLFSETSPALKNTWLRACKVWTAWALKMKFLEFFLLNETIKYGKYFHGLDIDLMNLDGMTLNQLEGKLLILDSQLAV